MRTVLGCALVALLILAPAGAREDDIKGGDAGFVEKASAAGLAEVNAGRLAAKHASSPEVKEFAEKMVKDHTKANKELISLANKRGFKVARTMDERHKEMSEKMMKLSGAEFDRTYMTSQVKDHEMAVDLFEKQSKSGRDEELKAWAAKTLPDLKEHLKMAKEIKEKVGRAR